MLTRNPYQSRIRIGELAKVIFPFATKKRVLAMLATYFDESLTHGTHGESRVIVVAGFVASVERWVRFEAQWGKILDDIGVEYFHTTDFLGKHGKYAQLSDTQREKIMERLVNVIHECYSQNYDASRSSRCGDRRLQRS